MSDNQWQTTTLLLCLGFFCGAFAQTNSTAPEPAQSFLLDPVIVEGFSLDAPHVENSAALENFGSRDVRPLLDYLPNVKASEGFNERVPFFTVRGSREPSVDNFQDGRGSVGVYIDDTPFADIFGRVALLSDVERVEFYNSPQGSQFGIPHSAGLLNITTRMPDNILRGSGSYSYGNYEAHEVRAQLAGPIVRDNFFAGFGGLFQTRDGYFSNRATGDRYGDRERFSGNLRLRWTPAENLEALFTFGMDRFNDDPWIWVPVQFDRSPFDINKPETGFDHREQIYQALRLKWEVASWKLKSITSHREFSDDLLDPTFLFGTFPFAIDLDQNLETWTQEIRAENNDADSAWRGTVGFYFSQTEFHHRMLHTPIGEFSRHSDLRNYALYGQAERSFGEHLDLHGGLRLQLDETSSHVAFSPLPGFPGPPVRDSGSRTFGGVLPTAEARWNWSEQQLTYSRFTVGMQPGGQRRATAESSDYSAQTSYHYELGHKLAWHEPRVDFHGAVFYTDYDNYHTFHLTSFDATMGNAKNAHALGMEADVTWEIFPGLKLQQTAAYTEAEFDKYDVAGLDLSGKKIDNIPEYTLQTELEFQTRWGGTAWVQLSFGRRLRIGGHKRFAPAVLFDSRCAYRLRKIERGNLFLREQFVGRRIFFQCVSFCRVSRRHAGRAANFRRGSAGVVLMAARERKTKKFFCVLCVLSRQF